MPAPPQRPPSPCANPEVPAPPQRAPRPGAHPEVPAPPQRPPSPRAHPEVPAPPQQPPRPRAHPDVPAPPQAPATLVLTLGCQRRPSGHPGLVLTLGCQRRPGTCRPPWPPCLWSWSPALCRYFRAPCPNTEQTPLTCALAFPSTNAVPGRQARSSLCCAVTDALVGRTSPVRRPERGRQPQLPVAPDTSH